MCEELNDPTAGYTFDEPEIPALSGTSSTSGSISFSDTERIDWISSNYRLAVTYVLPRSVHVGLRTALDDAMKPNDLD